MPNSILRLLVIEGHPKSTVEKPVVSSSDRPLTGPPTAPGQAYKDTIEAIDPDVDIHIVDVTGPDIILPKSTSLTDFDGYIWGGSGLHVYDDTPQVQRQIKFAQHLMGLGKTGLGSCWGLQVVSVAAGGTVIPNPKGPRFGSTGQITLNKTGRSHRLHDGRQGDFINLCAHKDIVVTPPSSSQILSESDTVPVQSLVIEKDQFMFFGMQYHPEFDLAQMAALTLILDDDFVAPAFGAEHQSVEDVANDWLHCHDNPGDTKALRRIAINASVSSQQARATEVQNWLALCRERAKAAP